MVIFESTVYPGLTEEICKPILEKKSKLLSLMILELATIQNVLTQVINSVQ